MIGTFFLCQLLTRLSLVWFYKKCLRYCAQIIVSVTHVLATAAFAFVSLLIKIFIIPLLDSWVISWLVNVHHFLSHAHMLVIADTHLDTEKYFNETISIPPWPVPAESFVIMRVGDKLWIVVLSLCHQVSPSEIKFSVSSLFSHLSACYC